MLLKPHNVKGDKAHPGCQGEGESQVCKLSPPSLTQSSQEPRPAPCATSGQGRNPCDAQGWQGLSSNASALELTAGTQPGCLHLTCFSLINMENLNRVWRSNLQQKPPQARLDTLQKAVLKRSLCVCLSIITDQAARRRPWEVSGRVMKSLAFLSSKFFAQTHPSISSDVPTAEPSPRRSSTPSQLLIRSSLLEALDTLLRQHIDNPHLLYFITRISQSA